MIKVFYGEKGTGKTKMMIETANNLSSKSKGGVVFIDDSKQLIYDLKHEIRFINLKEYPVAGPNELIGFICGIISQDYDAEAIFIDRLNYIFKQEEADLEDFYTRLSGMSENFKVDFYISMNGVHSKMPEYLEKFV